MTMWESFAGSGLALFVFLAITGGAAQQQVAQLSQTLGRLYALLAAAALSAIISAAIHAWVGQVLGNVLPDPWRAIAVAIVLLAAAVRLVFPANIQRPEEPTYSLGAITLVLVARQILAPPGLVIIAAIIGGIALYTAVVAGAVGSMLGLAIAWWAPGLQVSNPIISMLRTASAALVAGCAIYIAIFA